MHVYLNITQAKQLITAHPTHALITCCDGTCSFPPNVTRAFGFDTYVLSHAAFAYLANHRMIVRTSYNARTKTAVWAPTGAR